MHSAKMIRIDDWTPEARRTLLAAHEDAIRATLEAAFTEYADEHDLAPFGYHADDPVLEAVDDCVQRFASDRTIHPSRLDPEDRSFRLFTRPKWWLAQKVGAQAYRRIRGQRPQATGDAIEHVEAGHTRRRPDFGPPLDAFKSRLASTLRELSSRTCHDVVLFWLTATAKLRTAWFGAGPALPPEPAALHGASPKTRSFRLHGALFRFAVVHVGDFVSRESEATGRALAATLLSPCLNAPPYRVPDSTVALEWTASGVPSSEREVSELRKRGSGRELHALLSKLASTPDDVQARFDWIIVHSACTPTTLHALGIAGRGDLPSLIKQIRSLDEFQGDLA